LEEGGKMVYHDERRDYPVHEDAEEDLDPDLAFAEDVVERLELDFAEDGIHHHEQADGLDGLAW
jgi:hypothetical protein